MDGNNDEQRGRDMVFDNDNDDRLIDILAEDMTSMDIINLTGGNQMQGTPPKPLGSLSSKMSGGKSGKSQSDSDFNY